MAPKIVAHDLLPLDDELATEVKQVAPQASLVVPGKEKLAEELTDADIFFGFHPPEIFADARKLRWIQASSAGMDRLLTPELLERGLIITNASGVHAPQVAETAWALTLSIARGLPTYFRQQQEHLWKWGPYYDLDGATAGIVGLGGIGQRYAQVAAAFGMRVVAVDPHLRNQPSYIAHLWGADELPHLLRESDVVLISCPYTPETHHLMNRETLSLMKPTAILVNIARGGIVDEAALAEALRAGRLAGAGIDVCETEPLTSDSPLWDVPNLVITPHCAGLSSYRGSRLTRFFCENLRRYLAGEPLLNVVDPQRGYPVPED